MVVRWVMNSMVFCGYVVKIVELEMNMALLAESDGTDVTEEDYENIGGGGDPGAIGE